MKQFKITLFVYNRGIKKGEAFAWNFNKGYTMTLYRGMPDLESVKNWINDIHNSELLFVSRWKVEEVKTAQEQEEEKTYSANEIVKALNKATR